MHTEVASHNVVRQPCPWCSSVCPMYAVRERADHEIVLLLLTPNYFMAARSQHQQVRHTFPI